MAKTYKTITIQDAIDAENFLDNPIPSEYNIERKTSFLLWRALDGRVSLIPYCANRFDPLNPNGDQTRLSRYSKEIANEERLLLQYRQESKDALRKHNEAADFIRSIG